MFVGVSSLLISKALVLRFHSATCMCFTLSLSHLHAYPVVWQLDKLTKGMDFDWETYAKEIGPTVGPKGFYLGTTMDYYLSGERK